VAAARPGRPNQRMSLAIWCRQHAAHVAVRASGSSLIMLTRLFLRAWVHIRMR
jgi:hypothetical protein